MTGRLRVALTPGPFTGRPSKFARPSGDGVVLGALAPIDEADVALFPFEVGVSVRTPDDLDDLRGLVAENARSGVRTVMYLVHDHVEPIDAGQPDAVVLRTSMMSSKSYRDEHAMPVSVADPWADGVVAERAWTEIPRVTFMGQAGPLVPDISALPGVTVSDLPRTEHSSVFRTPVNIGRVLRSRALAALAASSDVHADIVIRETYFGVYDLATQESMRAEFTAQMRDSDYVLCVRGSGNFSIRLFETMATGRVPVLLETDLVLPCADVVDWDAICVRVPLAELDRIDQHVASAHRQGPERFAQRQRAARAAWERWLTVEGYARYVATRVLAGGRGA